MTRGPQSLALVVVVATILTVAVSTDARAADATSSEQELLSGSWSGSWASCKTRHKGKLRATFCRIDATHVRARFAGNFFKVIPFRYDAILRITHEEPGMMRLSGSQRLGRIMGTFSYQATITGDRFTASYRSKKDCGRWTMTRCCP